MRTTLQDWQRAATEGNKVIREALGNAKQPVFSHTDGSGSDLNELSGTLSPRTAIKRLKPKLNVLETRYRDYLLSCGIKPLEQAITLALDPPFTSYRPDFAYVGQIDGINGLILVETKGPHRFREKGIAKAALAAKTYPMFHFLLVEWEGVDGWKETAL